MDGDVVLSLQRVGRAERLRRAGVCLGVGLLVGACAVDRKGVSAVPGAGPDDGGQAVEDSSHRAALDAPAEAAAIAGRGVDGAPEDQAAAPDLAGSTVDLAAPDLACVDSCVAPSTLRSCTRGDQECPLGCSTDGGAHCRTIHPSGGGVVPGDLRASSVATITIAMSTVVHSDSGQIDGVRASGADVVSGIGFRVASGVAVFTFAGLVIAPGVTVTLVGPNPVALVAAKGIEVDGVIDARGTCQGTAAGPGGGEGGAARAAGAGPGGGMPGTGTHDDSSAGAGGGFGAPGGAGGTSAGRTAAPAGGGYPMTRLTGGSGGGGGGGAAAGAGGGGGGAVQMVTLGQVIVRGGVNAGGCGGKRAADDSGGGGGSGGAIVIEAPAVVVAAGGALAVNGGGGGASDSDSTDGEPGQLSRERSPGGRPAPGQGAGVGGPGGAGATPAGEPGGSAKNSGGGGGGVGRIVFLTTSGTATIDPAAVLSPALTDPATTAQQGQLDVR